MAISEVIGLFPTPLMRVSGALQSERVQGLVRRFSVAATQANKDDCVLPCVQSKGTDRVAVPGLRIIQGPSCFERAT